MPLTASNSAIPEACLQQLKERIKSKKCIIGIYGLGYVGLPLALRFTAVGIKVIGFDIDPRKVATLNGGNSYIERIASSEISKALENGFAATSDFSRTSNQDS